jgi:hypothetical protein
LWTYSKVNCTEERGLEAALSLAEAFLSI